MSTYKNLTADFGYTFRLNIRLKDAAGNPVDLTGKTVSFALWNKARTDGRATDLADVDDQGNIAFHIDDEVTATWLTDAQVYDVVLEDGDDRIRLMTGEFKVKK